MSNQESDTDQSACEEEETHDKNDNYDLGFYSLKNLDKMLCSKPMTSQSKTKVKDIIKVFSGPKQSTKIHQQSWVRY